MIWFLLGFLCGVIFAGTGAYLLGIILMSTPEGEG